MPAQDLPYSHPVSVATLHGVTHLKLAPAPAERAAMAEVLGLESIPALTFDLTVNHAQSGMVSIEGRLNAQIRPLCVVSLEAFDETVDTPVALRYAPEAYVERLVKRAEEEGNEDFEAPDVIEDGTIDFGQLALEFLALSLDPYPRKPGAVFKGAGDAVEEKISPFAALAKLKDKK
jgi:uncharacterized metal-binding protein YceD (DUF177 family)